jgi:DNA transposition AAA+ family ATPase
MSREKSYKEVVEELVEETTALKYSITRLANVLEETNRMFLVQESDKEELEKLAQVVDRLDRSVNKLDSSVYRLATILKEKQ